MRERRFTVPGIPSEGEVEITGNEAHHLLHVLRLKPSDEVVIFDGRGAEYRAQLTRCGNDSATARIVGRSESRESPLDMTLAVAVPKMDSMSRIVQKLTELGARRIIPIVTTRTTVTAPGAARQLPRWQRIAAEACKQSGRSMLPTIEAPISFHELLETDLPATRFLLTVGGPSFREQKQRTSSVVAVGPEGGWTAEEISAALARGFARVGLGPRTLRTETAALAAASVLQWLWGDSSP